MYAIIHMQEICLCGSLSFSRENNIYSEIGPREPASALHDVDGVQVSIY